MNIIAIANQKGGCGKTTTAINLAAELGEQEQRVLLIDMDPQGHASLGMGFSDRDLPGLYEVFCDEVTMYDVVLPDVSTSVDLVPANISLAGIESLLMDQPGRERVLLEHLTSLRGLYDYVLIDCPPSLGLLSINALRSADRILAPVEASLFALDGVQQLEDIVALLRKKYGVDLPIKVVPTMFDPHTRFAKTVLKKISEQLPVGLSGVQIRHTVRAREAAFLGKPLISYAPDSTAAGDYHLLAEEVLNASQVHANHLPEDIDLEPELYAQHEEHHSMKMNGVKPDRRMIVLTFNDIECRRLQVAGDFNDWIPDRDIETRKINGSWQKVFTAEPGIYEYRIIIDGKWQQDPTNPSEIPNEVGGINSLLQVPVHH